MPDPARLPLYASPPRRPGATAADHDPDEASITPFLLPCADAPRPCLIVCPGGGYYMRSQRESTTITGWINSLGLHAVLLDYRVAPWRHPAPLDDARRAVRLVRQHADAWRIDPERVGMIGFSAGGHLTASLACHPAAGDARAADPCDQEDARIDCAILCYPLISMLHDPHPGSRACLLGPQPDPVTARWLSCERHVSAATPPCFLWHTATDDVVRVSHSLRFAAACAQARVPCALHVLPRGEHGLNLATSDPYLHSWTRCCEDWLHDRGWIGQR